ncbi:MAG: hypothetical protein HYV03_01200 [Deltaproteobacteria bacterium]|nr:hypothetical protein [Deltaproteobacteria bacterium]
MRIITLRLRFVTMGLSALLFNITPAWGQWQFTHGPSILNEAPQFGATSTPLLLRTYGHVWEWHDTEQRWEILAPLPPNFYVEHMVAVGTTQPRVIVSGRTGGTFNPKTIQSSEGNIFALQMLEKGRWKQLPLPQATQVLAHGNPIFARRTSPSAILYVDKDGKTAIYDGQTHHWIQKPKLPSGEETKPAQEAEGSSRVVEFGGFDGRKPGDLWIIEIEGHELRNDKIVGWGYRAWELAPNAEQWVQLGDVFIVSTPLTQVVWHDGTPFLATNDGRIVRFAENHWVLEDETLPRAQHGRRLFSEGMELFVTDGQNRFQWTGAAWRRATSTQPIPPIDTLTPVVRHVETGIPDDPKAITQLQRYQSRVLAATPTGVYQLADREWQPMNDGFPTGPILQFWGTESALYANGLRPVDDPSTIPCATFRFTRQRGWTLFSPLYGACVTMRHDASIDSAQLLAARQRRTEYRTMFESTSAAALFAAIMGTASVANARVFAVHEHGAHFFAGTDLGPLRALPTLFSRPASAPPSSWGKRLAGEPTFVFHTMNDTVLAGTRSGVFRFENNDWQPIGDSLNAPVTQLAHTSTAVYAVTGISSPWFAIDLTRALPTAATHTFGRQSFLHEHLREKIPQLYRLNNGQATWEPVMKGLPMGMITGLAVLHDTPYVVLWVRGVYRLLANGRWESVPIADAHFPYTLYATEQALYVSTEKGVYRSE